MKSMMNKAKFHGKKIIVHLKRHHRKYFYGLVGGAILALIGVHTASTINNTFADSNNQIILNSKTIDELCDIQEDDGTIYCTGKKIEGIESDAFSQFKGKDMEIIDLSYNKLSNFDFSCLEGFNINNVDLSYNQIFSISLVETKIEKNLILTENCLTEDEINFINSKVEIGESIIGTEQQKACFYINYEPDKLTNKDVVATIAITGFNYDFMENFVKEMEFVGNSVENLDVSEFENKSGYIINYPEDGNLLVDVYRIDKDPPTCSRVIFSTQEPTSGYVDATLSGCSEDLIDGVNLNHRFSGENETYTFNLEDKAGNTRSTGITVNWIDKTRPTCDVRYSTTNPTNQNVTASLTGCSEGNITCTNCDTGTTKQHLFTGNGNFTFEFKDAAGNTGSTGASVNWINRDKPTCNVKYSTTGWTNQTVTATLTGCNKTGITVLRPEGSWTYPFTRNGTFTFEFKDAFENTGSTGASVSRIDTDKPECGVSYETQGETGQESTTARLTGCTEEITITNNDGNRYHVLGYSGSFTFEFKDRANNTGKTVASINMPKYTRQIKNSGEMISLYNENKSLSCEYNYKSGNYSEQILLYVKSGELYEYSEFSGYDDEYYDYIYTKVLFKNDKIFGWGSLFGSGKGVWADYEDFDLQEVFDDLFNDLGSGEVFMCITGVEDTSVFTLPDGIVFYDEDHFHFSFDEDVSFLIGIDDTINAGEYTDFSIKVMKDGNIYKDYTGTVVFALLYKNGDFVDSQYYTIAGNGFYDFTKNDKGRKTFRNGLKIKKSGTYILQVEGLNGGLSEEVITVKGNGSDYDDFDFDSYNYNPNYSDEMNKAYLFARSYNITTKNSIKDAKMGSGLNRIAMAKMLTNYAENVLGIDDFDTSRNCKFTDVSTALDASYDYGVTRACQLGIMGVNMKNNKFYPNGGVTRAEFATALSRLLYDTNDGTDKYYSTHIYKLYKEGIINNTDPQLREKRGYVMLMLMRATLDYDD